MSLHLFSVISVIHDSDVVFVAVDAVDLFVEKDTSHLKIAIVSEIII